MKTVPCVFVEGLTDEQRRAYILADNRLTELGEWYEDLVDIELADLDSMGFDVSLTGFSLGKEDDWFSNREKWDDSREEGNEEYNEFLDKFETPKTTDDCYTPDTIYEAVARFVETEYGKKRENFVRPFYPNGDYEKEEYKKGCVVVDNPPFSILNEILHFYVERKIDFFLFAPTLTLFTGRGLDVCYLPTGNSVTYENKEKVNTSFITNMENGVRIKTAPRLFSMIEEAERQNRQDQSATIPSYEFPPEVVTAASLSRYSVHGVELSIYSDECERVSALDAMKEYGKAIFGGGYLLSEKATERNIKAKTEKDEAVNKKEIERLKAAALSKDIDVTNGKIVWKLSDREKDIVRTLGNGVARNV